jgi:hypothetical protein
MPQSMEPLEGTSSLEASSTSSQLQQQWLAAYCGFRGCSPRFLRHAPTVTFLEKGMNLAGDEFALGPSGRTSILQFLENVKKVNARIQAGEACRLPSAAAFPPVFFSQT